MTVDNLSYGKVICREIGCAATGCIPTAELPPADITQGFCDMQHLHTLLASSLSLRGSVPPDYQPLIAQGRALAAKQIKMDILENELSRRFTEANIRHIVLKGSHTRSFYPNTLSRTSADIDWQISPADKNRADALLIADGWTLKTADNDERCYEKAPRARLELHLTPEGFHASQKQQMQTMFNRAVAVDGLRCHLTDSDAYVYAVFHLYKHFVLAGAGVRMFLDVYMMKTRGVSDCQDVDDALTLLDCAGFAACVHQINEVLFGGADSNADIDTLIRYVFAVGAYGDTAAQLALESLNTTIANHSRFKRILHNYCFDLASMKTRYPCLKRCALLYPFCAIHRVCHGLRFRRSTLRKTITDQQRSRAHSKDFRRILELASIL